MVRRRRHGRRYRLNDSPNPYSPPKHGGDAVAAVTPAAMVNPRRRDRLRRLIGILTLGGGAIGLTATFTVFPQLNSALNYFLCSVVLAVYVWGIWVGARLLEREPGSERLARRYWLLQVPALTSPVFSYFLSSGFHVTLSVQLAPIKFNGNFLLGSTFNYSLLQDQPWSFGVNVVAVLVVWWMARMGDGAAESPGS